MTMQITTRTNGRRRGSVFVLLALTNALGKVFAQERDPTGPVPVHLGFERTAFEHHGAPHQHLDARFLHNQFYFDRGYRLPGPPRFGREIVRGPDRFWYDRGQWYRRDALGWVVVGAPVGAFVSVLPPFHTAVLFGGLPYYYANDTYYVWMANRNEYEIVEPPPGIESAGTTPAPPTDSIFVYAKNGQSTNKQERDRYECYRSAVDQTGYDPTQSRGGVPPDLAASKRSDYFRAEAACLDARGYSVK